MKNKLTTFQQDENVFLVSVSITVRTLPQLVTLDYLEVGTSWEHQTWCAVWRVLSKHYFEPSLCCPVCPPPASQQWPTSTSFIHFKSAAVPFCMLKRWRLPTVYCTYVKHRVLLCSQNQTTGVYFKIGQRKFHVKVWNYFNELVFWILWNLKLAYNFSTFLEP